MEMVRSILRGTETAPAAAWCFRADLQIYSPQEGGEDRRHVVRDPVNDLSYLLGANELLLARLFDGRRSLSDIVSQLNQNHGRQLSIDKLNKFVARLVGMDLLAQPGATARKPVRDASTGISYGPFKELLTIPILRIQPMKQLDFLYAHFGWLCSPAFVWVGLVAILVALGALGWQIDSFVHDVKTVYGQGISWLLWHYPVVIASIAVHELGHALSCRFYRVRTTDLGIGVYLLLAKGWARPLQSDWSSLSRRQRMVTILMGPYGSLLFAAAGVLLWTTANQGSALHTLGLVMVFSSSIGLIPTLLPIFNGDTYLALTEYLGMPRLRQTAFHFAKNTICRRSYSGNISSKKKCGYWAVVVGTVLGWALAWVMLASLVMKLFQ
jgi:putative peptide zinc metalloprotease protein